MSTLSYNIKTQYVAILSVVSKLSLILAFAFSFTHSNQLLNAVLWVIMTFLALWEEMHCLGSTWNAHLCCSWCRCGSARRMAVSAQLWHMAGGRRCLVQSLDRMGLIFVQEAQLGAKGYASACGFDSLLLFEFALWCPKLCCCSLGPLLVFMQCFMHPAAMQSVDFFWWSLINNVMQISSSISWAGLQEPNLSVDYLCLANCKAFSPSDLHHLVVSSLSESHYWLAQM